ncbi:MULTISPECIES: aminotransferase class IV [unclassified Lentimicrobium]|uniref:aminotransferase class IV n=1 Tax=unclassified Lentimicrobium TaxID=2677434 RepID=UPI001552FC4C|nr:MULTISPECIES: aminotransferase class IV [unclassified Lentimicrobium]NPD47663.1 hypothetical protein [Lentimicrobium sp. S6]NPD86617.1 hypothetical protein [Lentimicrobium sp. L6]
MKLLETIQIHNGQAKRLSYHNERMNRSRHQMMCAMGDIYLEEVLKIPEELRKGKVKCRVLYDEQVSKIEFEHYQERRIDSFHLVDTQIIYDHKFEDRQQFNKLKSGFLSSSEIIMVKNGFITDTTYSNLIFRDKNENWLTPSTPLLLGTQREFLLDEGIVEESEIKVSDLDQFTHFMMINAMLDFDEERAIDIKSIIDA